MVTFHKLAGSWLFWIPAVSIVLIAGSCRTRDAKPADPATHASNTTLGNVPAAEHSAGQKGLTAIDAQAHDPAHPPIDCPKTGARLALIEFKEGKLPEGPPESAKIPRTQLISLAAKAGLTLDGEKPTLLPYQVLLVFKKP